jgi:hypothetical protein
MLEAKKSLNLIYSNHDYYFIKRWVFGKILLAIVKITYY